MSTATKDPSPEPTPQSEGTPASEQNARETRGGGEARPALPDEGARESAPLDDDKDRISLRSLGSVSAPVDLARTVPEIINRRSRGRFFGRKSLSDRLPVEWISLGMLILLAAVYAALKLLFTN